MNFFVINAVSSVHLPFWVHQSSFHCHHTLASKSYLSLAKRFLSQRTNYSSFKGSLPIDLGRLKLWGQSGPSSFCFFKGWNLWHFTRKAVSTFFVLYHLSEVIAYHNSTPTCRLNCGFDHLEISSDSYQLGFPRCYVQQTSVWTIFACFDSQTW